MKTLIQSLLFMIVMCTLALAQNIQLVMSPRPSPYISEWQNKRETAMLIVTNSGSVSIDAKIKTEVYNSRDELQAETNLSRMSVISISPGVTQFYAEDIYPLNALTYRGGSINTIIQTGKIPDDNYRICTYLVNPITNAALTSQPKQCKSFTIAAYQAPVLIAPTNTMQVPMSMARGIFFRWTNVIPRPSTVVNYRLQVWEILNGQSPLVAMRSNQPIVEKDYANQLQAQWPVDFAAPDTGKKYVWTITPLDDQDRKLVEGYGWAQPFTFEMMANARPPQRRSSSAPPDSSTSDTSRRDSTGINGTALAGDTILAGLNGEFKVLVKQVTKNADGSLTGKGIVKVNWLLTHIAVEFKNIKIDSLKRLKDGSNIVSVQVDSGGGPVNYPKAWGESWLSGPWVANKADGVVDWSNQKVDQWIGYVNNHVNMGQPKITYQSNIPPPPLPDNSLKMPFGVEFNNGNQMLVITEMVFKYNEAKLNFLLQAKFTRHTQAYNLGFAGKYFKFHPSSVDFSNGRVELVEDINLPNVISNPRMRFFFKKGSSNAGCYIQWADTGINNIRLEMNVKFTRDWLLPVPASSDSVMASFTGSATSMHDILFTGNLPLCEILGTNGMRIQASQMTVDLSDIRNPTNMVFPTNYPDTTVGKDWEGFYMKTFSITMPDGWKSNPSANPPNLSATNMIIDDLGLTVKILATNIFAFPTGRVANLSASLDTVLISMVCNSIVSGRVTGKLVLPMSKVVANNALKYVATFNQSSGANNYQLIVVPTHDIEASFLKGTLTLHPTSTIMATKTTNNLTLALKLNGVFHWDDPDLQAVANSITNIPGAKALGIKGVKMEMSFEQMKLIDSVKLSNNQHRVFFDKGEWSFASPQKRLANFPVTIKDIKYVSLATEPTGTAATELLRGAIKIKIIANLTEDIGGETTVGAAFALEFTQSTLTFEPKFKNVFMDDISVHCNMSAVKIDGNLSMFDHDPIYGDGFKSNLNVLFTSVAVQANALVQFGNTVYNNSNQYYRYWRAEADVKFTPGIPFLTGVGFYGFGGGAFYNMKANIGLSSTGQADSTYKFTPKKGGLGFVVKATIGTLPKFETLNADVSLMAQFSNSGGLVQIDFFGNFWLAATLAQRPTSDVKGRMLVTYNFNDKVFYTAASMTANVPPAIATPSPIGFVFYINGLTNKWYFKAGTPSATNTVKIFGINLYSYLMLGNDIPIPSGFTPRFVTNYTNATGSAPSNSSVGHGGVDDKTATGKGIAAGVGIEFSKPLTQHLYNGLLWDWSMNGNLNAGAELNLAFLSQTGCQGINGYRASGNLGLYAKMNVTVNGDSHNPNSYGDKSANLCDIKMGAWVEGKFPNPEYVAGEISAQISLFNDKCHYDYYGYFSRGTDCSGTETVTANAAQQDKVSDLRNRLIQYVAPTGAYNFPVTSTVNVRFGLTPDQLFDVAENQGDGTVKNRTFKLVVTKTLEIKNADGSWSALTVHTKANNLGEYMYYYRQPVNISGSQSYNASSTNSSLAVNVNQGNTYLNNNGNFILTQFVYPLPPPPPPNYPNPAVDPVNQLTANKDYRFKVTATLMEYGMFPIYQPGGRGGEIGLTWIEAKTRTGQSITENKTYLFRTGPQQLLHVNTNLQLQNR